MEERVFQAAAFEQPAAGEPVRSVVTESEDAVVVMWHVLPGQRIAPHVHPAGQDTWTVLSGEAEYWIDTEGNHRFLAAGDIAVARAGQVHGALNRGPEVFRFVSVVSPANAGYERVCDDFSESL